MRLMSKFRRECTVLKVPGEEINTLRNKVVRRLGFLGRTTSFPPNADGATPGGFFDLGDLRLQPRSVNEQKIRAAAQAVGLPDSVLCRVLGRYKMYVPTDDVGLSPHLMLDGFWEMPVTETLIDFVRTGMVVADIGANVGYYSLILADLVGSEGHVFSAEPNPKLGKLFDRTRLINGVGQNITHVKDAVTARSGDGVTLHVPNDFPQNASLCWAGNERSQAFEVRTTTLDDLIGPRPLDFVKIDVEGSEKSVWDGMRGIRARKQPLAIILEFTPDRFSDPRGFLQDVIAEGFALAHIQETGRTPATPDSLLEGPGHIDRMLVLAR